MWDVDGERSGAGTIFVAGSRLITDDAFRNALKPLQCSLAFTSVENAQIQRSIADCAPDLILADMVGNTGFECRGIIALLSRIRSRIPIVYVASDDADPLFDELADTLPDGFIIWPGSPYLLRRTLQCLLRRSVADRGVRQSEDLHHRLVQSMRDGVAFVDSSMVVRIANKRLAEMFGYELGAMRGMPMERLLDPSSHPILRKEFGRRRTGSSGSYEAVGQTADGSRIHLSVEESPHLDHEGRFQGVFGVFKAVDDEKRSEQQLRDRQERYALAVKAGRAGVWNLDIRSGELILDDNLGELFGYEQGELPSQVTAWLNIVHPDDRHQAEQVLAEVLAGNEETGRAEYRVVAKDRSVAWCLLKWGPERDETGTVVGLVGTATDVTNRKEAEIKLLEAHERLDLAVEAAGLATWDYDLTTGAAVRNDRWYARLGYEPGEIEPTVAAWGKLVHPEDAESVAQSFLEHAQGRTSVYQSEHRLRHSDGRWIWNLARAKIVQWDAEHIPVRVIGVSFDITERKTMEEELRESVERYHVMFHGHQAVKLLINPDTAAIVDANAAAASFYGYGLPQLKGMCITDINTLSGDYVRAEMRLAAEQRRNYFLFPHRLASGEIRDVEVRSVPVTIKNQRLLYSIINDVTDRVKAERALKESQEFLESIFNGIEDGLCVVGPDLRVIRTNTALERAFVHALPLTGKKCHEVFYNQTSPCADCAVIETFETGLTAYRETSMPRSNGTIERWAELHTFPLHAGESGEINAVVTYVRDITERKKAEELFRQAERYRAVADLTGGVAHNFNNLLQVVLGNANLGLMSLEATDYADVRRQFEEIVQQTASGAEVVRRLHSVVHGTLPARFADRTPVDLEEVVLEGLAIAESHWRYHVAGQDASLRIEKNFQGHSMVKGRREELLEAVVNLMKNAVEAMPDGGRLMVGTRSEKESVFIDVGDTGKGLAEKDRARLFTPFFTSKLEPGAGLGLATTRRIVVEHNGEILVDTEAGRGSVFTISLPQFHGNQTDGEGIRESGQPDSRCAVLVIDDMDAVVNLLAKGLRKQGYEVHEATSGKEAVHSMQRVMPEVILSDLAMPGMSGIDVARAAKALYAQQGADEPIFIILTGLSEEVAQRRSAEEAGVHAVLQKPVNMEQLIASIESARKR